MTNTHDFDYLDEWSRLADSRMQERYSEGTAVILTRILDELGDERQRQSQVIAANFVTLVRELREKRQQSANALGNAILRATELVNQRKLDEARAVYWTFLNSCTSKFYRRIAADLSTSER